MSNVDLFLYPIHSHKPTFMFKEKERQDAALKSIMGYVGTC